MIIKPRYWIIRNIVCQIYRRIETKISSQSGKFNTERVDYPHNINLNLSKILILTYQFKNSKELQIVYHITFISIRRYTGTYDFHARFEENEHKLYCFTTSSSKVNLAMGQAWIAESSLILLHDRVIDFACRNKYWNETRRKKWTQRTRPGCTLLPNFPARIDRKDELFISG